MRNFCDVAGAVTNCLESSADHRTGLGALDLEMPTLSHHHTWLSKIVWDSWSSFSMMKPSLYLCLSRLLLRMFSLKRFILF